VACPSRRQASRALLYLCACCALVPALMISAQQQTVTTANATLAAGSPIGVRTLSPYLSGNRARHSWGFGLGAQLRTGQPHLAGAASARAYWLHNQPVGHTVRSSRPGDPVCQGESWPGLLCTCRANGAHKAAPRFPNRCSADASHQPLGCPLSARAFHVGTIGQSLLDASNWIQHRPEGGILR